MQDHTRESLIEKAKEVAARHDGPLTRDDFIKLTGISRYIIELQFPDGGWRELADLAKIPAHPSAHGRFTNEDLLAAFHSVVERIGRIPSLRQFNAYSEFSSSAIIRRFGGIRGILKPYKEWLMKNDSNSPYADLVATKSKHEDLAVPKTLEIGTEAPPPGWNKTSGTIYGKPLNFRGLRHAPVNEQGVVYLFGMVAFELGLIVESIQAAFPDCEAKRCIDSRRDLWQRVRIEFGYQSSKFQSTGMTLRGAI